MMTDVMTTMKADVQDYICKILFMGNMPHHKKKTRSEKGDSIKRIIQVDKARANASRVSKLWHKHFRDWLNTEIEAEAQLCWSRSIKMSITMCNYFDFSFRSERAQYSLWIKDKPLIVADFECRESNRKNKKGLPEVVAKYGILAKYRHMHGVKKTIAKEQGKKWKKKIIDVPKEVFLLLNSSPEDKDKQRVWKDTMMMEMMDWFGEQHAGMRAKF
jgi:hypothetical protein